MNASKIAKKILNDDETHYKFEPTPLQLIDLALAVRDAEAVIKVYANPETLDWLKKYGNPK